jgi:hypothetical protein
VDYRKFLIGVALAVAAAAPGGAAPVTANSNGKALILIPLTLTKIDDLDFGTVITSPSSGTVAVNATTGARTVAGGVTPVASAPGHRAYFGGAGSPNQQVIVSVTAPATLDRVGGGGTIDVLALTLDNGGNPIRTIDATTRTFYVGVGGIINLSANQLDGDYSAVFQLTANYQ